jgi:hypothetical protein
VWFTSPAETRFLGGFVGSYGVVTADQGKVKLELSAGIAKLNNQLGPSFTYVPPPDYLERYARFHPNLYAQNWTASPDLAPHADVGRQLYEAATGTHCRLC